MPILTFITIVACKGNLSFGDLEDVGWMTWKLSHTLDIGKRREIISKILSARSNLVAEAVVSRKFKGMNLHRCPNCGLFVYVSCVSSPINLSMGLNFALSLGRTFCACAFIAFWIPDYDWLVIVDFDLSCEAYGHSMKVAGTIKEWAA